MPQGEEYVSIREKDATKPHSGSNPSVAIHLIGPVPYRASFSKFNNVSVRKDA